ncbi:uncharacterized protein LOC121387182 [Gigantopelta aegis]|uniref:uncharacterized protein LOC121387182 n=1 Tax=Gigantopelta aegis TaxID=1735272 RepID=UPI001B88AAD7|nr:uncharacterized protein LOC121387182 [Gigantopelta aegis]
MGCGDASGWAKMALIVLIIGMCLHIAGWATPNFMIYETASGVLKVTVGLWRMTSCASGTCQELAVTTIYVNELFNATRAMMTISFLLVIMATVLLFVYVFFNSARIQGLAMVCMWLCFAMGLFTMIGMIIWLAYIPSPFVVSFSLGLCILGMILTLIAGALLIPEVFEPRYRADSDRGYSREGRGWSRGDRGWSRGGMTERGGAPASNRPPVQRSWMDYN